MKIPAVAYTKLLYKYLKPQWRLVLIFATLMTVGTVLEIVNPQLLRKFIDGISEGGTLASLSRFAYWYITVALTRYICITIGKYLGERVGWTATDALRDEFVRHCLKLDMSFHKARTPGELIERLDGDINLLTNFFSQFVVGIVFNTLLLVGIVLALFMEDWRIGLGMMFFTILAVVVLIALNQKGIKNWAAARQANASFYGFLGERLSGTEDIRSCGANDFVLKRFYEALRGWLPKFIKADMSHFYLWIGSLLVFGIGMALVLATGALLYRAGTVSLGTVFLIFSYTTLLERPISQIRRQMQDLQRAAAAIDRVGKIFAIKSNLRGPGMGMSDRHEPGSQAELCSGNQDLSETSALPEGALAVEFDAVSFAYEDGEAVLRDISVKLPAGTVIGLLGRTGSGKTTLARLLLRLYDPTSGQISLGDCPTTAVELRSLRRRVGLVTQDVQLFAGTLRDNLTFFDASASDATLWQALTEIGIADWCRAMSDGLDTVIGANGYGMSAGEAQLLALARLFLADPGLIILDEASSRLDPATEKLVDRAIERLLQNRTGIIIAHRLATVQRADEILILDNGKVLEHGLRKNLAANPNSNFARLLHTGLEDVLA